MNFEKNYNPCFTGLFVQTQEFMSFSLFFSRESGNSWIIKAEKLFFSKKEFHNENDSS